MGIEIRAIKPEDVMSVAALLTQLNRKEGIDIVSDPLKLMQGLFGQTRKVEVRGLVAVRGAVLAVALYYQGYDILSATYGYHLADFVVEEAFRRQGMGRRLFAALATQNLAEGGEWISLTAKKHNPDAQVFYEALGMTRVGVDFFAIGPRALAKLSTSATK